MHNISRLIQKQIIDNLQYQTSPDATEMKSKMYSQQWHQQIKKFC